MTTRERLEELMAGEWLAYRFTRMGARTQFGTHDFTVEDDPTLTERQRVVVECVPSPLHHLVAQLSGAVPLSFEGMPIVRAA